MDPEVMGDLLEELQWKSGVHMPVANAANCALLRQVQNTRSMIESKKQEVTTTSKHLTAMNNHLIDVRAELCGTSDLVKARGREIETEQHLMHIIFREKGRLKNALQHLKKEVVLGAENKNDLEVKIYNQKKKLEHRQEDLKWDEKTVDGWFDYCSRVDDDVLAIRNFVKSDDLEWTQLEVEFHRLNLKAKEKLKEMQDAYGDTIATQAVLDGAAGEMRRCHKQRNELLDRWEYVLKYTRKRDRQLQKLHKEFLEKCQERERIEEAARRQQHFLEMEKDNNKELHGKMEEKNVELTRNRKELAEEEEKLADFEGEFEVVKRTCFKTVTENEVTQAHRNQLSFQIKLKTAKLGHLKQTTTRLLDTLGHAMEAQQGAEGYAELMDEFMEKADEDQRHTHLNLLLFNRLHHQKGKEFEKATEELKISKAVVRRERNQLSNVEKMAVRRMDESTEKQRILYRLEIMFIHISRRICHMEGLFTSYDDEKRMEAKIDSLHEQMGIKLLEEKAIRRQIRSQEHQYNRLRRQFRKDERMVVVLNNQFIDENVFQKESELLLKNKNQEKEKILIERSIVLMKVRDLRKNLSTVGDEVLTLRKRQEEIKTAIEERRIRVAQHKEVLERRLRETTASTSDVNMKLHERLATMARLKKKSEIVLSTMAHPEGLDMDPVAHYAARMAQHREELQCEGDRLDALIRRTERDIKALKNTVALIRCSNRQLHESQKTIPPDGLEYEMERQLQKQLQDVWENVKRKRGQTRDGAEDLEITRSAVQRLNHITDDYIDANREKEVRTGELKGEIEEQRGKIFRFTNWIEGASAELRKERDTDTETEEERDFELRELQDFNKEAFTMIKEVTEKHPEVAGAVTRKIEEAGVGETDLDDLLDDSQASMVRRGSRVRRLSVRFHDEAVVFPDVARRSFTSTADVASGRSASPRLSVQCDPTLERRQLQAFLSQGSRHSSIVKGSALAPRRGDLRGQTLESGHGLDCSIIVHGVPEPSTSSQGESSSSEMARTEDAPLKVVSPVLLSHEESDTSLWLQASGSQLTQTETSFGTQEPSSQVASQELDGSLLDFTEDSLLTPQGVSTTDSSQGAGQGRDDPPSGRGSRQASDR